MAPLHEDPGKSSEGRMVEAQAGDQLLPGIPNEITVNLICPKLPWTAFHILSRVNRRWQQAIQRRELYDARVRSQCTQTLVVYNLEPSGYEQSFHVGDIVLFSVNDGFYYRLPPIPGRSSGIRWIGQHISLDGRLYVLGVYRFKESHGQIFNYEISAEVYMMDLAGQGQWKQCASMPDPRGRFGCGVFNRKIYVFGGFSSWGNMFPGSEVYDPIQDAWSPIAPMLSFQFDQRVAAIGEEMFVHSGSYYHSKFESVDCFTQVLVRPLRDQDDQIAYHVHDALFGEVYNPLKNDWRIVKDFSQTGNPEIVTVERKLYKITPLGIDVYDSHSDSWRPSQSCSFRELLPDNHLVVCLWHAVPVHGEIIAIVGSREIEAADIEDEDASFQIRLVSSQRFGGAHKEVEWRELQCSVPVESVIVSLLPSNI